MSLGENIMVLWNMEKFAAPLKSQSPLLRPPARQVKVLHQPMFTDQGGAGKWPVPESLDR